MVRGSLMYLFILALLRLFRREAGSLSVPDLLMVVLVGNAAENAITAEYHTVTEGAVVIGTIFAWNYVLDWLSYRSRVAYRILHPQPLLLVKDGHVIRRNLRAELLTVDDLMSQLREQGVDDVRQVRRSYIEPNGELSVIKYQPDDTPRRPADRTRGI